MDSEAIQPVLNARHLCLRPVVEFFAGHRHFPWTWCQAELAGSAMFRSSAVPSGSENVHLTDVHRFCGEA